MSGGVSSALVLLYARVWLRIHCSQVEQILSDTFANKIIVDLDECWEIDLLRNLTWGGGEELTSGGRSHMIELDAKERVRSA